MKLKAKKSLGQNFLNNRKVVDLIVRTGRVNHNDIVLEIGPGKGILTAELIKSAGQVIAIEKDERIAESFGFTSPNLKIIEGDALDIDPSELGLEDKKYKVIANIPYYITGEIIRKYLENINKPSLMVIMVQKEVAKRIIDEKESLLSLSVKVYGKPKYIETVKSGSFTPAPKVDSAIILIDEINKPSWGDDQTIKTFFEVIKAGFSHKRKFVKSNLAEKFGKERINSVWKKMNINEKIRAENIRLEDWILVAKNIETEI